MDQVLHVPHGSVSEMAVAELKSVSLLHQRATDVPTTTEASAAATMTGPTPTAHDQATLASLATHAGAAIRGGGGGNAASLLALLVVFGLWIVGRVQAAEDKAEAARAAIEKTQGYEARLVRIEMSIEGFASAAEDIEQIKAAVERSIEDQRKTQGAVDLLVSRIAPDRSTPREP